MLPVNLPSITITANLTLNGVNGIASITLPVNSAPFCNMGVDSPAECVQVQVVNDTAPYTLVVVRANGWADRQDEQIKYEFGVRDSTAVGNQMRLRGSAVSTNLVGLRSGNVVVYVCAIDSQGSRACGSRNITIKPPPADFNVSQALASFDITALGQVWHQPH